jgi:hypothetical protein
VYFELSIPINRSPADVFVFLRDKDKYPQEEGSPVLVLEKTTPGPTGVGTCYREVVQMLPFYRGEILPQRWLRCLVALLVKSRTVGQPIK